MQRLLIGLVAVLAVAGAGYFYWTHHGAGIVATASMPASVKSGSQMDPMGTSIDPKDPGEIHFKQGRYPEAISYWQDQAANGNAQAAHRLGVEFMDGKPGIVQRDYAKAMQYHRQAALAGNALSMFDLGSMFEYGQGVPQDMVKSATWYRHSADYGLAQGQYNFATMLEAGEGVPKDPIEAYKFFVLAARGGFTGIPYDNEKLVVDRNAPTPTELLGRKLTREQVAEARDRADKFKAASGPLGAE